MPSIYGDDIFKSYDNINILYSEVFEHCKLFENFNDTIISENSSNTKNRILNIIKSCIQTIKDFIIWIKTKLISFWDKLLDSIKFINLKKSLKRAEESVKKKSNNESAILSESITYNDKDLQDFLNSKALTIRKHDDFRKVIIYTIKTEKSLITDPNIIYEVPDSGDYFDTLIYYSKDNPNNKSIAISKDNASIKEFIYKYDEIHTKLVSYRDNLRHIQRYYEKKAREIEKEYIDIKNKEVNSIEDIKTLINNDYKNIDIVKKYNNIKYILANRTTAYNYAGTALKETVSMSRFIDRRLNKYFFS